MIAVLPIIAVIFDIDGTLVADSLHREKHNVVLEQILGHSRLSVDEEEWKNIRGLADTSYHDYLLKKAERNGIDIGLLLPQAVHLDRVNRYYYENLHRAQLRDGAMDILATVEKLNLMKGAATNCIWEETERKLSACNLSEQFLFVRHLDGMTRPKPDPHLYEQSIEEIRKRTSGFIPHPSQILVIEDTDTGAEAGLRAGCRVILWPAEGTVFDLFRNSILEKGHQEGRLILTESLEDILSYIRASVIEPPVPGK